MRNVHTLQPFYRHDQATRDFGMLKFIGGTIGFIFLIGLLVVIGLLMLIF